MKPRVLIADDSRIVRATLIKHIEGMFDFREAHDGEQAWEMLLVDPNIRVVITDLIMPKLDGYGLLRRIRSSSISRIREIPVVVVSGTEEQEERDRAKAAGATDLITKGIGTAQLLSRLDILARLAGSQRDAGRSLEALADSAPTDSSTELLSPETLNTRAQSILADALSNKKNFVILNIRLGLKHARLEGSPASPPTGLVVAVGQLLQRTARQTDCLAKTGEAEFTLATGSINFDAARLLAQRLCRAIASANLIEDERMLFIASCGMASLSDYDESATRATLETMRESAQRRGLLAFNRAVSGVVGPEEENAIQRGNPVPVVLELPAKRTQSMQTTGKESDSATPDMATLLQWIKEGKQDQVLPYMEKLSAELRPLLDLLLHKNKR